MCILCYMLQNIIDGSSHINVILRKLKIVLHCEALANMIGWESDG